MMRASQEIDGEINKRETEKLDGASHSDNRKNLASTLYLLHVVIITRMSSNSSFRDAPSLI